MPNAPRRVAAMADLALRLDGDAPTVTASRNARFSPGDRIAGWTDVLEG
jgi:hypothetical protein